ncbi:MAG: D-aminoacylase [Bryobacteraceae bacterium]|nr:D-aminoacylase [Bryobacteraceae bacterium]
MMMESILLRNGMIIDGSGKPGVPGDLLMAGDRIAETGRFTPPRDARVIDCTGLTVAPGFIDVHSHSDLQVLENLPEKAVQGVTSEVVGNCGFSPYPAAADRKALHEFANGIFRGEGNWGWPSSRQYLQDVRKSSRLAGVSSLLGHGTLRIAHAGPKQGPLEEKTLQAMERTLDEALYGGSCGFSTGLMYAPGSSAPYAELLRLCKVVARRGKVYSTHMRNYSRTVVDAVEEQLKLARESGCRLEISHFQAAGRVNWKLQAPALEKIEQARAAGVDVAFDCYPYVAGSTVLTQLLPQWTLDGGADALMGRLKDPGMRAKIAKETVDGMSHDWQDIFISAVGSANNQDAVGTHLAAVAEKRSKPPIDAMIDLLIEEKAVVNMISFNQSDDNLRQTLTHPLSIIISDGFYVKGKPHPRLHGTFPLWLGEMVRNRKWLPLHQAVHKITARPAGRFGIARRGLLLRGYYADVTVFDAGNVMSPATYEKPEESPVGIRYVFREGKLVVEGGKLA